MEKEKVGRRRRKGGEKGEIEEKENLKKEKKGFYVEGVGAERKMEVLRKSKEEVEKKEMKRSKGVRREK